MTELDKGALDRWITGNYGEDQFADTLCYYCGESTTDDPEGEYVEVGIRGVAHASCVEVRE